MSSWPIDPQQDLAEEYHSRMEKRLAHVLAALFPEGFIMVGKLGNGEYVRSSYNIKKEDVNGTILKESIYQVVADHVQRLADAAEEVRQFDRACLDTLSKVPERVVEIIPKVQGADSGI